MKLFSSAAKKTPCGYPERGCGHRAGEPTWIDFSCLLRALDDRALGWLTVVHTGIVHRQRQDFGRVKRLPIRELGNLLPATESVGNQNGGRFGLRTAGKQNAFAYLNRHIVLVTSKPNEPAMPQQPESSIS